MPVSPLQNPGDPYYDRVSSTSANGGTSSISDDEYQRRLQALKDYQAQRQENVSTVNGGEPYTINPDNYKVASQNDYVDLARNRDAALARQGVQIDNTAANRALAQSMQARAMQAQAGQMYGRVTQGLAPSAAQEQMRMALDAQTQAQARQAALQGGARAVAASTNPYAQIGGQGAAGRQQETQQAYIGQGRSMLGVRGGDIQALGQSQQQSYAQGQLESEQQTRNDALARAYLGQGNNLSIEQLGADQAYEQQKNANVLAARADEERKRELQDQQNARVYGAVLSAAGSGISAYAKGASADNGKKP